jgi:AAA15 family ATPase/GTPase
LFIHKVEITDFRQFKNKEIKLGKYITAIAGFNATGKSTLLALLAQCGELKGHKSIVHSSFRADLSEILKFSEDNDRKIPYVATLYFIEKPLSDDYPSSITFRAFFQGYNGKQRYRIIPKKTPEWKTERKLSWPTLYLGLGRLYPVGESVEVTAEKLQTKLDDSDNSFIIDNAKDILSLNDDIDNFTAMKLQETEKKKAIGFNTDTYNYLCNSAGQDNIGQILLTVLSCKKLKDNLGDKWYGGLLLIDEVDAVLHPLAQNKLVKFLYNQAKSIGFQVVFTTHSLSLLEFLSDKTQYNTDDRINNYEIVYITNANRVHQIVPNPSFDLMYRDLMVTYEDPSRKIPLFSEDEEARFFIRTILENYLPKINLLEVSMGCDNLLGLLTSDFKNFSHYLFILDGDVKDSTLQEYAAKVSLPKLNCVIKLPGNKRPEELLWDYINSMDADHPFLNSGLRYGYTLRAFQESGPMSDKYNGYDKDRKKYKEWFKDNKTVIEMIIPYWIRYNQSEVNNFIDSFITAYNITAKLNFLPKIERMG